MATSSTCLVRCILCMFLAINCNSRQDSERYIRIGCWDGLGGCSVLSSADAQPPRIQVTSDQCQSLSLAPRRRRSSSQTSDEKIHSVESSKLLSSWSGWPDPSRDWSRTGLQGSFVSAEAEVPTTLWSSTRKGIRRHRNTEDLTIGELKSTHGESEGSTTSEEGSEGYSTERIRANLVLPLMSRKDCWEKLRGDEFVNDLDGSLLDAFANMCQQVVTSDTSDWIDWRPTGKHGDPLDEQSINVWVGRAVRVGGTRGGGRGSDDDEDDYCGSHLPIIKSQSVLPFTPLELVELLLDSGRVRTYNKWSLGRLDVWVHPDPTRRVKIVKNRTKPPVGLKPLVSTTMMHARRVSLASALPASRDSRAGGDEDSWIVVSRAVGGNQYCDDVDADCGRSDILLGINLLQPVGNGSTLVTAVTHVQSSVVPSMLAESLGLKGAIQFVQDLRRLRPKVLA